MIINSVKITNFRSHTIYKLDCNEMTSLILGENGCGKTSVLEAIYIAMQGKSFRAVDRDILKRDSDFYKIEVLYKNNEKIIVVYDGEKKQFLIKDKKYGRLPKKNRYPIVFFEPSDLNLIHSSPTKKRSYFDGFLSSLDDKYNINLNRYNKALKQRNEALKSDFLKQEDLFSWNIILAKYGCEIHKKRKEIINKINNKLTDNYRFIANNKDEVEIVYYSDDIDESEYFKKLENNFERDKITGYTSFGVHRDDYKFIFNKVDADGSASRGETRSLILALKFIEAEILLSDTGKKPLILLDDVFSELDETRQKCLIKNFQNHQVILTSVKGVDLS